MKTFAWRRSNWLATLSMAGITTVFMVVFFLPEMKTIRQSRDDIRTKYEFSSQEASLVAAWQAAIKNRDETAAFLSEWDSHSARGREVSQLFSEISQLASSTGTSITRLEPGAPVDYQELRQLSLSISCEGYFSGCMRLLAEIERLPQAIWVEETKFERTGKDGEALHCDLTLAIFADKSEISD